VELELGRAAGTGGGRISAGHVLCCRKAAYLQTGAGLTGRNSGSSESFLRRLGWREFRRILAVLRELCPAAKPVVVRTAWLAPEILGECTRRRHRFVVRLNNQMGEGQAVEVLIHEWAHALAWNYSLVSGQTRLGT